MKKTLLVTFSVLTSFFLFGQVANDDCFSASFIQNTLLFCSDPGTYNNVGSTASEVELPGCWDQDHTQDVWYSFSPQTTAIFFQIFGADRSNNETLRSYSFAVYQGRCSDLSLVLCGDSPNGLNIIERTLSDLVIGRTYYLRISSTSGDAGTFEICMEGFNAVPDPQQDCIDAVVLCDKSPFVVDFLVGAGRDNNEADGSCLESPSQPDLPTETSSAWYKWTAETSGTLTFTLTPNNVRDPEEDLDFAVYQLPNGIGNCTDKVLLRCVSSGESQGNTPQQNAPCFGSTGLSTASSDFQEFPGCAPGDDNFVAAINMVAGESYALIINNYSQSGFGFNIAFGGTGTFRGPQPDFSITAADGQECDKTIFFDDMTTTVPGDSIVSYRWSFGEGASPLEATGSQRHEVVYSSFGTKLVALTIETVRGCIVTEILEVIIDPCCANDSDLAVSAETDNLSCYESGDGSVVINGIGGQPEYLYSFNNGPVQPSSTFNMLAAGTYTVAVQDRKGCMDTDQVTLIQPEELQLILNGPLDSLDLGDISDFSSEVGPEDRVFTYQWDPAIGLSCTDCPDPQVTSRGTRIYTLTITDQDGCSTDASITLFSRLIRNFYAPNVLSKRSALGNEQFKIFVNQAAEIIEDLSIYDRWGTELYHIENVVFDDAIDGWIPGNNNPSVNPGVYAWVARIRYVDGIVLTVHGAVTVVN